MWYAQLTNHEVEYCSISRDTTDSDLKQRREITDGTAVYVDQAPVRAAIHGRILILDGIEKAERNVLPTLNNLLENREMGLPDGRFLVAADRYDALLEHHSVEELNERQLVRVHPDFQVVALGLPVPVRLVCSLRALIVFIMHDLTHRCRLQAYPGFPLDPPLRSRFQSRFVDSAGVGHQMAVLRSLAPTSAQVHLTQVLSLAETVRAMVTDTPTTTSKVHHFPELALPTTAAVLGKFPAQLSPDAVMHRAYPYRLFGLESPFRDRLDMVVSQLGLDVPIGGGYHITGRERVSKDRVKLTFTPQPLADADHSSSPPQSSLATPDPVEVEVAAGTSALGVPEDCVLTPLHECALADMCQDHAIGRDLALVGPKGSGKSMLARAFANSLGYVTETIHMYKDMTSRDLLQRRTTDEFGNTRWELTPLVTAALSGGW